MVEKLCNLSSHSDPVAIAPGSDTISMPTIQLGYGHSSIDFDYESDRFEVLAPNEADSHACLTSK
jgi:hypothetical protein